MTCIRHELCHPENFENYLVFRDVVDYIELLSSI